jgi:hypothetical protein
LKTLGTSSKFVEQMEEEFENQLHKFVEFEQKLIDVV